MASGKGGMVKICLVRPGATSFDEEGRMKGCLDIPLCEKGLEQANSVAKEIVQELAQSTEQSSFDAIYSAPCQSAQETAGVLAKALDGRVKLLECMQNVDHGLWQGKLIDEVRRTQPTVYKNIQEHPEAFAPPGGERLEDAQDRVRKTVERLVKKHKNEFILLIVPDPLASLIRQLLVAGDLGDLWKAEKDAGSWELIALQGNRLAMV